MAPSQRVGVRWVGQEGVTLCSASALSKLGMAVVCMLTREYVSIKKIGMFQDFHLDPLVLTSHIRYRIRSNVFNAPPYSRHWFDPRTRAT
jgi:hypothetical protein